MPSSKTDRPLLARTGNKRASMTKAGNSCNLVQLEPEFYPDPVGSTQEKSLEEAIYITPAPQKYDVTSCDPHRFRKSPAFSFRVSGGRPLAWYTDKGLDVTGSRCGGPDPGQYDVQDRLTSAASMAATVTGRQERRGGQRTPAPSLGQEEWGGCRRNAVSFKGRHARDVSADFGLQQEAPLQ